MSSAKQKKELQDQVKYNNYINTAFKNAIITQQAPIKQDIVINDSDPLKNQLEIAKNYLDTITNDPIPIIDYLKSNIEDLEYFIKYFDTFIKTLKNSKVTSVGQFIDLFTSFRVQDLGSKLNIQNESSMDKITKNIVKYSDKSTEEINKEFLEVYMQKHKRALTNGDRIEYLTTENELAQTPVVVFFDNNNIVRLAANTKLSNERKIRYILKYKYFIDLPKKFSWSNALEIVPSLDTSVERANQMSVPSSIYSGSSSNLSTISGSGFPNRKVLKKKSVLFR